MELQDGTTHLSIDHVACLARSRDFSINLHLSHIGWRFDGVAMLWSALFQTFRLTADAMKFWNFQTRRFVHQNLFDVSDNAVCDNAIEKLEIEQNIRRVPLDGLLVAKVCWWPHQQQRNTRNTWNVWPPSHRTCSNCVWKGEPVRCMRVHWCLELCPLYIFWMSPPHCVLLGFLREYFVPRVCELYASYISYSVLFLPGPLRWPWTSSTSSRSWELCQALWAEGQSGKIIKCHEMSRFFVEQVLLELKISVGIQISMQSSRTAEFQVGGANWKRSW